MDDADRFTIDGPMFYLIHGIRAGYDDFTVEGVLSTREDAENWVKELEQLPYMQAVAPPQRLPLKTVIDLLVRDRLKQLAETIDPRNAVRPA
jgi:hypothetical protein